ncbi:hypothetical protein JCM1841_002441 [Sporobolomyces salmonicolor]
MEGPKAYSPCQLELDFDLDDSGLDELLTRFPPPPPRSPHSYMLVQPALVGYVNMTSLNALPEIALPPSPLNTRESSEVVLLPSTCAASTSPNRCGGETHSSSDDRTSTVIAFLEATRTQASLRKATSPFQRPVESSKPAEALSIGRNGGHQMPDKNAEAETRRKRTFGMSDGLPDRNPTSSGRGGSFGPRSSSLSPPKKKNDARHRRLRNMSIDQTAQTGPDSGNESFDGAQRPFVNVHRSDHCDHDLTAPSRNLSLSDAETTGENQMRRPPPPVSVPRQPLRGSLAAFISVNHTSTSCALPVSLPIPVSPVPPPPPATVADPSFVFSRPAPPTPASARRITERLSPFREAWPYAVVGTQGAFEEGPVGSFTSGNGEGRERSPGQHECSDESPSTSRVWMDDLLGHYGISEDHSSSASLCDQPLGTLHIQARSKSRPSTTRPSPI